MTSRRTWRTLLGIHKTPRISDAELEELVEDLRATRRGYAELAEKLAASEAAAARNRMAADAALLERGALEGELWAAKHALAAAVDPQQDTPYDAWLHQHALRQSDIQRGRSVSAVLAERPLFSVLMPVYNTVPHFLDAAIRSVEAQTYDRWELCIADDASTDPRVREVLETAAARDPRITVVYRPVNGHICEASNTALAAARGDFVGLLDHDDLLTPDALQEMAVAINLHPESDVLYSDEDKVDEVGVRSDPYFKPDWSPEALLSRMYLAHFLLMRTAIVREAGAFRPGFEGSQDHDLALRVTERARRVTHIPAVLYHWRTHADSTAAEMGVKPYAIDAAVRAIGDAAERRNLTCRVEPDATSPGAYVPRFAITRRERVSIIVPTRDHVDDVRRCLESVFRNAGSYADFEVILVDNGSTDPALRSLAGQYRAQEPQRFVYLPYDVPFNFSEINNYAVRTAATGAYLLFLNNDTEVIASDWLAGLVEYAQQSQIGAVGATLLYPDDTIQHAGVVIGIGGVAGHSHKYYAGDSSGYFGMLRSVNNYSAVTGACLMTRREVFEQVGGFDEALSVAFNDVDLCLRIVQAGYRIVMLPHVRLYHHESKSRGAEDSPEKRRRFNQERRLMQRRWHCSTTPDPFYSPHLTLTREDYSIRI